MPAQVQGSSSSRRASSSTRGRGLKGYLGGKLFCTANQRADATQCLRLGFGAGAPPSLLDITRQDIRRHGLGTNHNPTSSAPGALIGCPGGPAPIPLEDSGMFSMFCSYDPHRSRQAPAGRCRRQLSDSFPRERYLARKSTPSPLRTCHHTCSASLASPPSPSVSSSAFALARTRHSAKVHAFAFAFTTNPHNHDRDRQISLHTSALFSRGYSAGP